MLVKINGCDHTFSMAINDILLEKIYLCSKKDVNEKELRTAVMLEHYPAKELELGRFKTYSAAEKFCIKTIKNINKQIKQGNIK
jgi:hypothetical protein